MFYQLDINHKFLDAIVHHRLRFDDRWTNWDKVDLQTVQYCNIVVTILQYCIKFCQSDIDFIPINGLYSSSGQISTTGIEFFAQQSFQFTVHIMCSEFSPAGPSNNLRIPILDKISIQNESYIWSKVRALQSWQTESYLSFINEIHLN